MDVSAATWWSELEMEECDFKNPNQMKYPFIDAATALSTESLTDYSYVFPMNQSFHSATGYIERAMPKQPKSEAINTNRTTNAFAASRVSSSNTFIMSFGNPNSPSEMNPHKLYDESNLKYSGLVRPREEKNTNDFLGSEDGGKRVLGTSRNGTQAQDHVLAERKRREILTRRFIALSALLPNLKKMDKATVLEDATKYIKQLQTRMKELEEETSSTSKKYKQESAVSIRRSKISCDSSDDAPSSIDDDETDSSPSGDYFNPEIEVRISERSVLVKIYCKKNSSVAMKTLNEMERLLLTISCSSVIPFSSSALLITITGQMSEECVLTAMDIVKCLQSAISSYI
ncbi:hypothetical protein L1887_31400 [Cichorium endivia]|nr:hypothetical protein L1887_31400 [Cichorium endivia]